MKRAARRLLGAVGLATQADLERERAAAARVRSTERERAARAASEARERIGALDAKLQTTRERAAAEHAERTNLGGLLRHYLLKLAWTEAELSGRLTAERRVKSAQLLTAARLARRKRPSPAATARAEQLASMSAAYREAAQQWRSGQRPPGLRQLTIAGLQWSVLGDLERHGSWSKRMVEREWLPIEDLGTVRQFAVGGVMLDIGAHVGTTAIPRVVLGDFSRAYAAEPHPDHFLCLVGNTIDNRLIGRVLADQVEITDSGRAARADGVPSMTLDEWVDRLRIPVDDVRFVRLAIGDLRVNPLAGAARLLERRQIVWQIEIMPGAMAGDEGAFANLCAFLGRHFTHVREIGGHAKPRLYSAAEAWTVLGALAREYPPPNFLVFNLARTGGRRRNTREPVGSESAGD